ncbi:porin [Burkholderia multivorans]|uniref:porin n=1 Tax=Burkholderia multivorans TaxID=87883 RepID=UPI0019D1764C|nr:porin [Burkholderia multivorans]MBN6738910.1 porin [Burkholderia multivorans]MBN7130535.1 porin [Burkholderia multivorans]QSL25725.1 porin [Burkholderia multivorans]
MNKSLVFLAVSSVFLGAAHAQSSVTLYGIVDEGLTFNSNAKGLHQYALTSGNASGSRWGMKGSEDLGGGTKAIFTLEGGFNTSTGALGQNGDLFGRQVFVGLTSNTFGTLTLGRQYESAYDFVGGFSAGGDWAAAGAGYGAHPGDLDNLDGTYRINNTVKYLSPTFNGLSFGGVYSLGGVAGNVTRNQIYSFGVGYKNGGVALGAGYTFIKDPNFSLYGNKANDSAAGSNMSSPAYSGYATAGSQQIINAGGSYTAGIATLSAVYSNVRFNSLGTVAVAGLTTPQYSGSVAFNIEEVGAKFHVTPALQLAGSYAYTKSSSVAGKSGAKYNQFDLGADYAMSARTDFYLDAIYQVASGHDSTGKNAVAAIDSATSSSNNHQLVAVVGMRHRF